MTVSKLAMLLPKMIHIPEGTFTMGTPDGERSTLAKRYGGTRESYAEESPEHEVFVAQFAIAETLVTNALYACFQQAAGAHMPITWRDELNVEWAQHPVVDVSWNDAQALCVWLKEECGLAFRLPSEAEWEKAARGTDRRAFPWSSDFDRSKCNVKESGVGHTTPVTQYVDGASPFGVLDMAGNVWEWTQSLQAPYPYVNDGRNGSEIRIERQAPRFLQRLLRREGRHEGPQTETRRILRGGCFANPEGFARSACRLRLQPEQRTPFLGIRLAQDGAAS